MITQTSGGETPAQISIPAGSVNEAGATSQPDVSQLTLEQIDTLMETGSVEVPAQEVNAEKVVEKDAPAPVQTEPVAAATETPAPEPEPVEELDARGLPKKIRLSDDDMRIALLVKNSEGKLSFAEAERIIKTPVETAPPEELPAVATAEEIQGEIAEIKEKLKAFDGELVSEEYTNLQEALSDKKRELEITKEAEHTSTAKAANFFSEARSTSKARATEVFPDVADASTPLGKAVSERIAAAKADPTHPDYEVLQSINAPFAITALVASEMGIAPKAKQTPPAAIPAQVPPRQVVSPVSGAKSTVQPAESQTTGATLLDRARKGEATLEELDAAQGASNDLSFAIR